VSIRVFVCICERGGTKDLSHCPTDVRLALLARLFVCVCVRCMCVCVSIRVLVCMCERGGAKGLSHCPTDV